MNIHLQETDKSKNSSSYCFKKVKNKDGKTPYDIVVYMDVTY